MRSEKLMVGFFIFGGTTKMVIIMKSGVTKGQIEHIIERIEKAGLKAHASVGEQRTLIGVIGDKTFLGEQRMEAMPGVKRTMPITAPYKLASRDFKAEDTIITINGVKIDGSHDAS